MAALSELTQWTYSLTYALPFHYPQDFVYCEVEFNIEAPDLAVRDFEDAFNQLAQFVTVFPEVKKDFEKVLSKIDATTNDKTEIDQAAIAVESFLAMVTNVQKVASSGPGLIMAERRRDFVGTSALTFNCYIQEGSITYEGEEDVLLVAIIVTKPGAIDIKKMPPVVEIEGYDSLPQGTDCGEKQGDGEQSFCYVYKKKDQNGERAGQSPNGGLYLSAKDGQSIAKRQVKLLGLDILQCQDAISTVHINRNELLIPGKPTAKRFVYTTAEVQFANPLHPTIDTSKKVNIAEIPSKDSPAHRSLTEHLNVLLDALLLNNTQESLTFQVEATYGYSVNPILSLVPLPLLMQAPLDVQVVGKTQQPTGKTQQPTRDQMVADWSAAIVHWFTCHRPAGTEGTLRFDLTIMSNLTKQAMPLLRLRNLELPIRFITPPLDIA